MKERIEKCEDIAKRMRRDMVEMSKYCGGDAHWGGAMSCTDALAVLYGDIMNCTTEDLEYGARDRFILSKGHNAMALYTALVETGIESPDTLEQFQQDGSIYGELAIMNEAHGIECSGGSLGLGLPMGVGMALKAKREHWTGKIYVMTGDGEVDEGSVWEAAMAAAQFQLNNLVFIVDRNGMQSDGANCDIMSMDTLDEKLTAFGFDTVVVNGHDYEELIRAFERVGKTDKPNAVILDTVKGKGISFMENDNQWHHEILKKELLEQSKKEVGVE